MLGGHFVACAAVIDVFGFTTMSVEIVHIVKNIDWVGRVRKTATVEIIYGAFAPSTASTTVSTLIGVRKRLAISIIVIIVVNLFTISSNLMVRCLIWCLASSLIGLLLRGLE